MKIPPWLLCGEWTIGGRDGSRETRREDVQATDTGGWGYLRMPSPHQKPPLPEFIPGGAKQTEGEGGVSQLLQQLGEKVLCQCLSFKESRGQGL